MRIALNAVGDTGHRAGRILLAEAGLDALGLYGHGADRTTEDRRMTAVQDISGFDVLVSDTTVDPLAIAAIAAEDSVSCVLGLDIAANAQLAALFHSRDRTLLLGATLGLGIATTLALRELQRSQGDLRMTIAWTEPGRALRRGEAVPFPDPVGPCWGRRLPRRPGDPVPTERIAVPLDGPWAAAFARIKSLTQESDRVIGVADHADHLNGIALAAGAIAVAEGAYTPGAHQPADNAEAYIAAALRIGLEVAAFDIDGCFWRLRRDRFGLTGSRNDHRLHVGQRTNPLFLGRPRLRRRCSS